MNLRNLLSLVVLLTALLVSVVNCGGQPPATGPGTNADAATSTDSGTPSSDTPAVANDSSVPPTDNGTMTVNDPNLPPMMDPSVMQELPAECLARLGDVQHNSQWSINGRGTVMEVFYTRDRVFGMKVLFGAYGGPEWAPIRYHSPSSGQWVNTLWSNWGQMATQGHFLGILNDSCDVLLIQYFPAGSDVNGTPTMSNTAERVGPD